MDRRALKHSVLMSIVDHATGCAPVTSLGEKRRTETLELPQGDDKRVLHEHAQMHTDICFVVVYIGRVYNGLSVRACSRGSER